MFAKNVCAGYRYNMRHIFDGDVTKDLLEYIKIEFNTNLHITR